MADFDENRNDFTGDFAGAPAFFSVAEFGGVIDNDFEVDKNARDGSGSLSTGTTSGFGADAGAGGPMTSRGVARFACSLALVIKKHEPPTAMATAPMPANTRDARLFSFMTVPTHLYRIGFTMYPHAALVPSRTRSNHGGAATSRPGSN